MKSYQHLFAELKRRSVFKVVAVYGGTSFALLQLADLLKDGFGLPETFVPFVTAIVLLGFPLALILAWAFELAPGGVRRTEAAAPGEIAEIVAAPASSRWPAGLLALAGFLALFAGVWIAGQRSGASAALGDAAAGRDAAGADGRDVRFAYSDLADDDRASIAVLPFVDLSPAGDQEYFSDGITEEILNVLAKVPELRVTARTSAFAFKGRQVDLRMVGDSLGVRYLVEGSVRKAGNQLRITAQLIDAADGSHLWSESYDRTLDNVFQIQTEIAEAVADELRLPLGITGPAGLVTPTADLEAYDLYLAARSRMKERGASLREAVTLLEAAIARDSTWAPAWAALAEARELRTWYPAAWDLPPTDDPEIQVARFLAKQEEAAVAARRALELDPAIASAHVALGSVYRNRHEWEPSEAAYLQALKLDPDNAEAHQQYSELLLTLGRIAEGRRAAERALALDRVPVRLLQMANALLADGRSEAALDTMNAALALDPERRTFGLYMAYPYAAIEAGRYDRMFDAGTQPAFERDPTPAERSAMIAALRAGDESGYPRDLLDSSAWIVFGRPDSAAATMLEDLRSFPYQNANWIWDPHFVSIRDEPAFREVLALLNLEGITPQLTPREAAE